MLHFSKYQGTGNDFIIINNLKNELSLSRDQVQMLCDRKFGIGADGLMLLQTKEGYDFEMKYYNSDGNESTMCGNGGRCMIQFAHKQGIEKETYLFYAIDGGHEAKILQNGWVELKMKDVNEIKQMKNGCFLNTGSPHFVQNTEKLATLDVYKIGKIIRNSVEFIKEGVNVNFVEQKNDGLFVRTYERGVEDETLSCGTGVTAAAIVFAKKEQGPQLAKITTSGGELMVKFKRLDDNRFTDIWLCGPATFVFEGKIELPEKF